MEIVNDRLLDAPFMLTPNQGGAMRPELLLIHYTVSWPGSAVVRGFGSSARPASAHLVLDLDGSLTQMVEFRRKAWHAGESAWRGRPRLNDWSIGIEIVNPGPVFVSADGSARDVNKRAWGGGYIETGVLKGYPSTWTHWAKYSDAQLVTLEAVSKLLCQHYGLREILGHSDVAPGRKFDPGPALPMDRIRSFALGTADTDPASPPQPSIAPPLNPSTLPVLRAGAKGDHVKLLQERLRVLSMLTLAVDGDFGPMTSQAVYDFQRRRGLTADAVVRADTWAMLLQLDGEPDPNSTRLVEPSDLGAAHGSILARTLDDARAWTKESADEAMREADDDETTKPDRIA